MIYNIDERFEGKTVKQYLYAELHFSHALVTKLKHKENGIVLDGKHVFVTAVLHTGSKLQLSLEDTERTENLKLTKMPLDILYEDDYLIAVNKQPGLPTHPSLYHYDDTLANGLAYYYAKQHRPFVFRAVNRLDRDTSGVILVSKDKNASAKMNEIIAKRRVDKRYYALLEGNLPEDHGFIEKKIKRVCDSIILRTTDENDGEYALTEYNVLERKSGRTLVIAYPHTGRTHQLRVHFSSIGHPIEGDDLYGNASPFISRQALHACSLTFIHPFTEGQITISAPLPDDFAEVLKEYRFERIFLKDQN